MTAGIFITGTNTGVGKTAVTAALLRWLGRRGVRAAGLKPVASGATRSGPSGELRNADALELQDASPVQLPYTTINPYCFEPAIAPHLAAREAACPVEVASLVRWYADITTGLDIALVEGAGGWRVPLYPRGFLGDLPEALGLPIVLVVGLTLGCLNHARLTAEAIDAAGRSRRLGWIANAIDPGFERSLDNLATLEDLLGTPPLAVARHTSTRSAFGTARIEFDDESLLPRLLDGANDASWHARTTG